MQKDQSMRLFNFEIKKICVFAILTVLCLTVYANSINNEFIIVDDNNAIINNPGIYKLAQNWSAPHDFLNSLCYQIAEFNVIPYHIASIIFHILSTVLLFLFLKLLFSGEASFLGACLFAVHPMHTEVVTWISGRSQAIMTFFVLTIYLLFQKITTALSNNKKVDYRIYFLTLIIFSYNIIENYPFFILFCLVLVLSEFIFNRLKKSWKLLLPFICISLIRAILALGILQSRIETVAASRGATISLNNPVFNFIRSFFVHLWLLVWPAKLTMYHEPLIFPTWANWCGLAVILLLFCFIPLLLKKAKPVVFGLGIFIIFLIPTYLPFSIASSIAERYVYFPSIFLFILLSFLFEKYYSKKDRNSRKWIILLFICILFSYSLRTIIRNRDWKNNSVFARATLKTSPYSPRAHNNMGIVYRKEKNYEKAIEEFTIAIKIAPDFYATYNNLGYLYKKIGKQPEALEMFKIATEKNPNGAQAFYNLGNAYRDIWHVQMALSSYEKSLELNPNYAKSHRALGDIYVRFGKFNEAIFNYKKAIEIDPKKISAYINLNHVYSTIGEKEKAKEVLLRAREITVEQGKEKAKEVIDSYLRQLE